MGFERLAARWLLRGLLRLLGWWQEPVQSIPQAERTAPQQARVDTRRWAMAHPVELFVLGAPAFGAAVAVAAWATSRLPLVVQVFAGAVGGLIGAFLLLAVVAGVMFVRAFPRQNRWVRAALAEAQDAHSRELAARDRQVAVQLEEQLRAHRLTAARAELYDLVRAAHTEFRMGGAAAGGKWMVMAPIVLAWWVNRVIANMDVLGVDSTEFAQVASEPANTVEEVEALRDRLVPILERMIPPRRREERR